MAFTGSGTGGEGVAAGVGEEEAFDGFVGEVEAGLRRALVAAYGMDVGNDAAMDALVWAWQHWPRVHGMENPGGYLFRVGQTSARRRFRRDAHSATLQFPRVVGDDKPEFEPALDRSLCELSSRQRAAVVLVHGYGYSLSEAAQLMGCSVSTVRNHNERALRRLRDALGVDDER